MWNNFWAFHPFPGPLELISLVWILPEAGTMASGAKKLSKCSSLARNPIIELEQLIILFHFW